MSKPVDIKIAQFTKPENLEQSIDSSSVWEIFQKNNNEVLKKLGYSLSELIAYKKKNII